MAPRRIDKDALVTLLTGALSMKERPTPEEQFRQDLDKAENNIKAARDRYEQAHGEDELSAALTECSRASIEASDLWTRWQTERRSLGETYKKVEEKADGLLVEVIASIFALLSPEALGQLVSQIPETARSHNQASPCNVNTAECVLEKTPNVLQHNADDLKAEATLNSVQTDVQSSHGKHESECPRTAQSSSFAQVEDPGCHCNARKTPRKRSSNAIEDETFVQGKKKPRKSSKWEPDPKTYAYSGPRGTAVNEIEFAEVYKDGNPEHPHWICSYDNESFHIYRCDKHGVMFNDKPAQGAAKHLRGKLHGMAGNHREAYEVLSIGVLGCDIHKQALNNEMMKRRLESGFVPTHAGNTRAMDLVEQYASSREWSGAQPSRASPSIFPSLSPDFDMSDSVEMVEDDEDEVIPAPKSRMRLNRDHPDTIVPGLVYQGWQVHCWRPVVALPSGSFEEIGLTGTLEDTGLLSELPPNVKYEKGQFHRVSAGSTDEPVQLFPVMHFDARPFPLDCTVSLMELQDLQKFERNASELNKDLFAQEALKYLESREKRRGATGPDPKAKVASDAAEIQVQEPGIRSPVKPHEQAERSVGAEEPSGLTAQIAAQAVMEESDSAEMDIDTPPEIQKEAKQPEISSMHASPAPRPPEAAAAAPGASPRTPLGCLPEGARFGETAQRPVESHRDGNSLSKSPAPPLNLVSIQARAFSCQTPGSSQHPNSAQSPSTPAGRPANIEAPKQRPQSPKPPYPRREEGESITVQPPSRQRSPTTRLPPTGPARPSGHPGRRGNYTFPRNPSGKQPVVGRSSYGAPRQNSPPARGFQRPMEESPYGKLSSTRPNESPHGMPQGFSPQLAARHDWS